MLIPIIISSDKTTVSIGTGQNEYWPVYLSIGNIHNNICHAHRNSVVLLGFLAIPKHKSLYWLFSILTTLLADKQSVNDLKFHEFQYQLFHTSLSMILEPLHPTMTTPEVIRCPDNHFHRAMYSLGVYVGDYPEQALLANIVQGWCAKYAHYVSFNT